MRFVRILFRKFQSDYVMDICMQQSAVRILFRKFQREREEYILPKLQELESYLESFKVNNKIYID